LIAGKFDPSKALALTAESFGAIPKPARELPVFYTQEPAQDGERSVIVRRVGDSQGVMAGYHIPAGYHPDFAAVSILTQVMGDSPSGRLYKALVESKKAAAVLSFDFQLHDPGMMILGALVRKDAPLDVARDTMLSTIEEIHQKPVTAEEL